MVELSQLRRGGGSAGQVAVRPVRGRVFIETYGCQMNVNDGELMAGMLAEAGYVGVQAPEDADVIVINTCAIREHAERRVLGRIGELQRLRQLQPDLVLAVTGCMAQRLGGMLVEKMSGVDLVAGPDAYRELAGRIHAMRTGVVERGQALLELDAEEDYNGVRPLRREGVVAWVTVQRGCNHRCTFCIVPYVRGPEKNRSPSAILDEVREAVGQGYTAVTLLGQTVNSYMWGDWDFARLLRAVARVPGVCRIRFTSPHPNDVNEQLLEVMRSEPTVCRQLHMPAQSGADRILKRMVRRYTVGQYLAKVELVRRTIPGIALSTDLIVGFPGETEQDFEATLDLVRHVRYDDAYLYRYSPREGTPATRFPEHDFIADDLAHNRLERLIELHRSIQREINVGEVGEVREVHVERRARSSGDLLGRTSQGKVVAFAGHESMVGEYRNVRLTGTSGATFTGKLVG